MSTQITNRAHLTYSYGNCVGSAISNVARTTLHGPMTVSKHSLCECYHGQKCITFIVSITNTSSASLSNVVATDDLGAYSYCECSEKAVPLSICCAGALLINGHYVSPIEALPCDEGAYFNVGCLASNDTAVIIYTADVTDGFYPNPCSGLTNGICVTADGICSPVHACCDISVERYADIRIIKSMSPDPVVCGDSISYNFTIYNYGNADAENVVLTDNFSPIPEIRSISINGVIARSSDYSMNSGELVLPINGNISINVPAATFSMSTEGTVNVIPGVTVVTVNGTVK